jgi:hypothetical protein
MRSWVPAAWNDTTTVLVDIMNIKRTDSTVSVWQLIFQGDQCRAFYAIVNSDPRISGATKIGGDVGRAVTTILATTEAVRKVATNPPSYLEYDCRNDRYRYLNRPDVWKEITPDSIGAEVEKNVCKHSWSAPNGK